MKKCVLVCLFLVFIFPTSNALSVDFQWAWMWSDHSKDINGVTDYRMIIDVGVNSDSVTVTLNLTEYDEHIPLDPCGPNPGSPGYFD